jgi:arylsulfatase A-like enzyme
MLGDHYHWRKTYPFEGSARIPFVLRFPDGWRTDLPRQRHVDAPIGLEDVMPTLLDAVGVEVPETVEGRSVLPLVADADSDHAGSEVEDWRAFYHGENTPGSYHPDNAHQYAVDGRWKYVYFPVTGADLLFDLDTDPLETTDLSDDSAHAAEYERCRSWLTDRLADRPEGFVVDGELTTVDADSLTPDGVSLEAE